MNQPPTGRLASRAEAAEVLGYSERSLQSLMSRQPDRWPAPAGQEWTGRGWRNLYDLDELKAVRGVTAQGTPKRVQGIADEAGLVVCLECGERRRSLPRHLQAAHGMTTADYRVKHGLPQSVPLIGEAAREALAAAADKRDLSYLDAYRDHGHLDAIRPAGIQAHRESLDREVVKQRLRPGQTKGVAAMVNARVTRLDEIAQAAGWDNLRTAIEDTRHLSAVEAARRIGVSKNTVQRRRNQWASA